LILLISILLAQDMETRPSDKEILGLYVWAGKGISRGDDEAVADEDVE
jgi:hypothetical protein